MQGLLHHLILRLSGAVQLTAYHHGKIFFQIKMLQYAFYIDLGFAGSQCQKIALGLQVLQHLRNTGINFIFKNTRILKTLSVFCHGLLRLVSGKTVEFHKAVP